MVNVVEDNKDDKEGKGNNADSSVLVVYCTSVLLYWKERFGALGLDESEKRRSIVYCAVLCVLCPSPQEIPPKRPPKSDFFLKQRSNLGSSFAFGGILPDSHFPL